MPGARVLACSRQGRCLTGRGRDHFCLRQEHQAGRWSSVGAQVFWNYGLLPWYV